MYDSFLYGNGLTLALFSIIEKIESKKNTSTRYYYNYNNFLETFLHAKEHQRILRDFYKYFDMNGKTQVSHDETRKFLVAHEEELYLTGYEQWISKHIFEHDSQISNVKVYSYILYNYWYHLLHTQVLQEPSSIRFLEDASAYISSSIKSKTKIYTTNFDTLLDQSLSPKHLHGIFSLPLREIRDVILDLDRVKNEFEYTYLFGTNGFEKLRRLDLIRKLSQDCYDLEFLFQKDLMLGHLLVYGISFGNNQIMPDDYLEENPENKDFHLLRCVDGHVVSRLEALFEQERVNKVTISYYTKEDLENIKNIFDATDFKSIVEYKHASEIFDFNALCD